MGTREYAIAPGMIITAVICTGRIINTELKLLIQNNIISLFINFTV